MARKRKRAEPRPEEKTLWDFTAVMEEAEVLSKEDVAASSKPDEAKTEYSPIDQTADYMARAVRFEEAWETTIASAREKLLTVDPRNLYLDFFDDVVAQAKAGGPKAGRWVGMLEAVGVRGLGMTKEMLSFEKAPKGGTACRIHYKRDLVRTHIEAHVCGEHFLNVLDADHSAWEGRPALICASDVSQHRSSVPVPAKFFKRTVPFVLNNAAGSAFRVLNGKPKYDNLFNPKPDETLLRWMLIDPSYQDELEPEDYNRCLASAMDVGQYKFDLEFLMKKDGRRPDIIFRDGSLFPQDAYLDNFFIDNKRGEFTREAIREFLACLLYAERMGFVYCGVSKNVQLKVYSSVLDWYIFKNIDKNWDFGSYTFNDGEAMSMLLSSGSFVGSNLSKVIATCLVRRSFTTRANLNTRAHVDCLAPYFKQYQDQHEDIDITPFKALCEIGHVYMFFMGHSKNPQQRLPRYEFFINDKLGPAGMVPNRVLAGVQTCGIQGDDDHSFMAEKPVTFLIPGVTQQAHILSKDVGKHIDAATGQWIMSRYKKLLTKHG
jgi:hypothetical protein